MILLPLLLALGATPPLTCPPGTEHRGVAPFEGYEEWCETPRRGDLPGHREGPFRSYYDDGGVWIEASYHEGLLQGPWVERFRGGKKAREGAYQADLRSGPWTFYYEDGTVLEETAFTKGLADGPFADYWPNGRLRNTGRRCLGVQCGRWVSYDDKGHALGTVDYGELRGEP